MIRQIALGALAVTVICGGAAADLVTIDFESDAAGPVPNGFMSASSPLVSFSDSLGAELEINTFGIASIGQGLAVGGDLYDTSLLVLNFATVIDFLSIDVGNDLPTAPFNTATLTLYLNDIKVGATILDMNNNGAMDESISFSGALFNSATLDFYDGNGSTTEIVDNIAFNTIPAPGALAVASLTLLLPRRRRS